MRTLATVGVAVGWLTALVPGPDGAQDAFPCPLTRGDQVLLTAPALGRGRLRATVESATAERLELAVEGGAAASLRRDELTFLRVRTGTRRQTRKGAAIGLLVWAAIDVWAIATGPDESGILSLQNAALLATSVGVGAGIGALNRTDRWATCPPAPRALAPGPLAPCVPGSDALAPGPLAACAHGSRSPRTGRGCR